MRDALNNIILPAFHVVVIKNNKLCPGKVIKIQENEASILIICNNKIELTVAKEDSIIETTDSFNIIAKVLQNNRKELSKLLEIFTSKFNELYGRQGYL